MNSTTLADRFVHAVQRKYKLSNKDTGALVLAVADIKGFEVTHMNSLRNKAVGHSVDATQLTELSAMSVGQLEAWTVRVDAIIQAESAMHKAQCALNLAKGSLKTWAENGRPTEEEELAATIAAAEVYWESEGKYEEELEESGQAKSFHYENDRRRQFGKNELSAREFLA